jgi:uncharacterized protein YjbI with pentapeptide repeats
MNSGVVRSLPNARDAKRIISGVTLEGVVMPLDDLENITFKSCKWNNLQTPKRSFRKVVFDGCEISNIDLREAHLEDVTFINSTLTNVVMNDAKITTMKFSGSNISSSDHNIMNGYRNIHADQIIFENSELVGLNFFESKAIFKFFDSKLYDVSGVGLVAGSSLYFHNSHASLIDFDQSELDQLEVINSTIDKRSSAGGASIRKVRIENSRLNFSLGDTSNMESVVFSDSGDIVVGGGRNNGVFTIRNCPKDTYSLNVVSDGFEKIYIENCHVVSLTFGMSRGKLVSIKNSSAYEMDLRSSTIEELILENVSVRSEIEYTDTKVEVVRQNNLSFDKDIEIYRDGSNFELKPDTVREE